MLYSCAHMATVGVKGLIFSERLWLLLQEEFEVRVLRQMGNNAIALLKEAASSHPELAATAQLYLDQVHSALSEIILLTDRRRYRTVWVYVFKEFSW